MNFDVSKHTVYMTTAGSHSYGTAIETSDFDVKGVVIPPMNYFLGYNSTFEQLQDGKEISKRLSYALPAKFSKSPIDGTLFDIRKFFKLAADCNPNVLECLFVRPEDVLICHDAFTSVVENRQSFLSRRVLYTFQGYAVSQLKRIKTHRDWLLNPPKTKPQRIHFGLDEHKPVLNKELRDFLFSKIQCVIDGWNLDLSEVKPAVRDQINFGLSEYLQDITTDIERTKFEAAGHKIGLSDDIMSELDKERKFKQAQQHYDQFVTWEKNRNTARAELEKKFGYDTKHGLHLVRLLSMCEQILSTGTFETYRPDAERLLEIRKGGMSYDELILWTVMMDVELKQKFETSTLPKHANHALLEQMQIDVVQDFYMS